MPTQNHKLKLFQHQMKLVTTAPDRHALIWETGSGKSYGAISLAVKKTKKILIICPKGLVVKWKDDIKQFPGQNFLILSKETFKRDHKTLPKYDCVIVDEAHYFFGTKSQLMKSLRWYLEHHDVPYRYFLSGTPYRSSPMDIYIMCTLLGKKLSYWSFQTKFFYQVRMGMRMVPVVKKGIEKDIADIVRSVGSIVRLEECIDMPEAMYREEYFPLTNEQKEAIKLLPDTNPIVRYTKIHQICGGTLKGNEYEESQRFEGAKIHRTIELAEEIERLIIVCRYNEEIDYLKEKLVAEGHTVRVINGAVENRHEILEELCKMTRYVLIVNASCCEGWQLQNCNHMIFYSYSFELKNKIQMEGRLRRIDAPRPVLYISLAVKDSIDEAVCQSLKNKESFHVEIYAKQNSL